MTITIFLVSLFCLVAIIGSKILEEKKSFDFMSRLGERGDVKIHQLISKIFITYKTWKKIASIFIFEFLPCYAYELSVKLKDYLAKKYYTAGDGFRGRRVLRGNGSVSFFLERLSDKKTDSINNKI